MGLKKYIFGSILLIVAIFAYVFTLEPGDYRLEVFDYVMILPIAAWVVVPVLFLFIVTVLHIIYYGLKNYFALKSVKKDSDAMLGLINSKLLGEESKANFQNAQMKKIASILKQLDLNVSNQDFSCEDQKIKKTAEQIFAIESGKYISNKELKLPNTNKLMEKNILNRIDQDENYALEALKKPSDYSEEILKKAFDKTIETKSITTLKKLIDQVTFDENMVVKLLKKDSEQDPQFAMENEQILALIKKVNLTSTQLVTIANNYKAVMSPDQILALFEELSNQKEEYINAYLYVLAEYEMIDKIRDIIDNSGNDEYLPYKALVDLKDAGKHIYSLDTLCYK
jgi:hypothetical protein